MAESVRRELPSQPNAQPTRAVTLLRCGPLSSIGPPFFWLVAVAASLVLAIACANLGSLMLVRDRSREHLAATQVALGASAWRLMRAGLIETALLGLAGTAISLPGHQLERRGGWLDSAARLQPYAVSVWDTRVLAVCACYRRCLHRDCRGVSELANCAGGCARCASARDGLGTVRPVEGRPRSTDRGVGLERHARRGGDHDRSKPRDRFDDGSRLRAERPLQRQPELAARDGGWRTIPSGIAGRRCTELVARCRGGGRRRYQPDQRRPRDGALGPGLRETSRWQVTSGFFDTMGMRVLAGRHMSAREVASDAPVGVLSEAGLRMVWPASARTTRLEGRCALPVSDRTVVGVVSDVRESSMLRRRLRSMCP